MITSLRLHNFKNFADETLRVGPFTVIVGANASGKSNIRDAFRFLHGIGRGYTLAEIVGGKYGADWKPIRGSASGIVRFGASPATGKPRRFALEVGMRMDCRQAAAAPSAARYVIEAHPEPFGGGKLAVLAENLRIGSEEIYSERVFDNGRMQLDRTQPALFQILRWASDFETYANVRPVIDELHDARFFEFRPERMREPASPGRAALGDSGEYLPIVLKEMCDDPKRKSALIDWVRELTPMDVKDFKFSRDPSGKVHLVIREKYDREVSAENASDGTLRFLAMLAALLGKKSGGLYFFEELESGLHPSRLHLLVDLIEQQTAKGRVQVIATTHSPELVSMISDKTFENTSVTCRLEDSNDAIIRSVADLPNAKELRKNQGLGRLLAGGWMETALAFTEGRKDDRVASE